MPKIKGRLLYMILVALVLSATFTITAWIDEAEASSQIRAELDNGLTVILEEKHSSPVTAFQMWVKVGAADETAGEEGLAHVFEHMLFKGTAKREVGQIAREVDSAGGYINAYTSYDQTVYHLVVASRYASTALDIISDAVQNSTFDPVELAKELDVVKEEIRMGEDRPRRKLFKSLVGAAYKEHPYGRPVIGTMESVGSFTREGILKFFNKWYAPNNMTLVVVGDFDPDDMLNEIKSTFASFKKDDNLLRPLRTAEPVQREPAVTIDHQPIAQARMAIGFHIPDVRHKDTFAMDVLALILGQGASSRLYKRLKVDNELVSGLSATAMTPKDPGLFIVRATLDTKNIEETIKAISEELERLKEKGPSEEELKKGRLSLESDFIYERETMEGRASQLGYYETIIEDLNFERSYVNGVNRVNAKEIERVAKKYFTRNNMTISLLLPDEEMDQVEKRSLLKAAALKSAASHAVSVDKKADDVAVFTLPSGLRLLIKEDHTNPTVAIYATFPGGLRFESAAKNGLARFTASMLTRGTKNRTREELAREVEGMAASIGGFSGRNSWGVSGKFLSRDIYKGLDLLSDLLLNPTFPQVEIERHRNEVLAAIRREKDNLPGYAFKLLRKEHYKSHPYGMPLIGTTETVESFVREDLLGFLDNYARADRMIIAIVGDVDSDDIKTRVADLFIDFKGDSPILKGPASESAQDGIRKTGESVDKAQTNIAIAFPGVTVRDEDRFALSILAETLSGMGGRLFVELRDRKSLAYSLSAFSSLGVDPGIFGLYIGTSPGKRDVAVKGIFDELEKLRKDGITAEELERAKSALIGGYEIGLQEVSSRASDMAVNELLGLGHDYHSAYPEKLNAVTRKDVLRVAREYLKMDKYTISIVGPKD